SFHQNIMHTGLAGAIELAGKMISDGADILDIGGQSTRPGSTLLSISEELKRVLPVVKIIHQQFPECIISIDTFYAEVAERCVAAGASLVNDVSGGTMDKNMFSTVAGLKVPYVCMHMPGTPQTMQKNADYEDVVQHVLQFFINTTQACVQAGIHDVIVDPGFGFGKTTGQNFKLLKKLSVFKMLDKPILVGLSRKASVYKTLCVTVSEALNGTTVLHTLAIQNGANILRVHDVKEAKQVVTLMQAYKKATS
ncbi:MAG: dihydropteroate synthase, partial [Ferruginibacter sp.]